MTLWSTNTRGKSLEKQCNLKSLDAANQSIEIKHPKRANGDAYMLIGKLQQLNKSKGVWWIGYVLLRVH